jgi:hypothetical protein
MTGLPPQDRGLHRGFLRRRLRDRLFAEITNRHVWSCESCGHEIEMAVNLRFDNRQSFHKH